MKNPNLLRKNFFHYSLGQYWTLTVTCWTPISVILEGLPIYRFRVILGRRIRICREKFFGPLLGPVLASTGPVLDQGVVQKIFSQQIWNLRPKITLKWYIETIYLFKQAQVQYIVFEVQYWSRKWPKNFFLNGIKFFTINLVHMHIFSFLVWLHLF